MSKEYLIIEQKQVADYLNKGWILYGNPLSHASLIWQAVIADTTIMTATELLNSEQDSTNTKPEGES